MDMRAEFIYAWFPQKPTYMRCAIWLFAGGPAFRTHTEVKQRKGKDRAREMWSVVSKAIPMGSYQGALGFPGYVTVAPWSPDVSTLRVDPRIQKTEEG